MSLKMWTAGALAAITLGWLGGAVGPVAADEGARQGTQLGVVWLGSLSTGYVVGQDVERGEHLKIVYSHVPVAHMVVQDTQNGEIYFEGKPEVGQSFWFHHGGNVKFTLWSAPAKEYPPMAATVSPWPHERPILDAMQLQVIH